MIDTIHSFATNIKLK